MSKELAIAKLRIRISEVDQEIASQETLQKVYRRYERSYYIQELEKIRKKLDATIEAILFNRIP